MDRARKSNVSTFGLLWKRPIITIVIGLTILILVFIFGGLSTTISNIMTDGELRAWLDKPITEIKIGEAILAIFIISIISDRV